jgi:hypothetical protein
VSQMGPLVAQRWPYGRGLGGQILEGWRGALLGYRWISRKRHVGGFRLQPLQRLPKHVGRIRA